jgi:ubiquinone/menaquinone biosynthesis C-methylase UbiE
MVQKKKSEVKYYDGDNLPRAEVEEKVNGWISKAKEEMDNFKLDVFSYYLSKHIDFNREYRCLDACCGPGHVSFTLEKKTPFIMVGMDLSNIVMTAASRVKNYNGFNTELIRGDLENSCFKKNSFDLVLIINSLHHFPDFNAPLESAHRILKDGGMIIVEDSNLLFFPILWRNTKCKMMGKSWGSVNEQPFTRFRLKKSLLNTGFKIKYLRHIRYLPFSLVRKRLEVDEFISNIPILNLFGSVVLGIAQK